MYILNKQDLSERDICTKYITPAVKQAGWYEMTQLREEVTFTKGCIIVPPPRLDVRLAKKDPA